MEKFNKEKAAGKVYNKINNLLVDFNKQIKAHDCFIGDVDIFWFGNILAIYITVEATAKYLRKKEPKNVEIRNKQGR